jgi:hypothetical protein
MKLLRLPLGLGRTLMDASGRRRAATDDDEHYVSL